jgi:NAD(P)H dehydrogenase (quinone)
MAAHQRQPTFFRMAVGHASTCPTRKGFPILDQSQPREDLEPQVPWTGAGESIMNATKKSKHVVILSHPEPDSFNAAVAAKYCAVVQENGQEAVLRDLYRIKFDPVLQGNEQPGSAAFRQSPHVTHELDVIADAAVLVLVYPIWFGTPPAMLKGYVDRVLGSDFSFRAVKARDAKSRLAGAHLLSLTSSGTSQIWLDEQGEFQSLVQVFDRYLERAFSMASTEHVHFSSIVDGLSERFFLQYMQEVREAAEKSCHIVADDISAGKCLAPNAAVDRLVDTDEQF